MTKLLPKDLTSYDFFKTFAVLLMIVDHVGYYFFPDDLWWRVAGRLCVPIWFFLIGYARSRDLGPKMWGGMLILVAANVIVGIPVFALNILGTMIAIRLLLDLVMRRAALNYEYLWGLGLLMLLMSIPTNFIVEYGTLGLLIAMFGYMARHEEELAHIGQYKNHFMVFAVLGFVIIQTLTFGFAEEQLLVFCAEMFVVFAALYFFKPAAYPQLTAKLPSFVVALFQFFGRRTLGIYVFHLVLFKGFAAYLYPDKYDLLHVQWFP